MSASNSQDMTQGPIISQLCLFAIPVFFSALLSQLYIIVDSLIIGRFAGDSALAAVTNCVNAAWFITSFQFGCGMGVSVVISQAFGARNWKWLQKSEGTAVACFLISGLILALCGLFLSRPLLNAMNTPADVMEQSVSYLVIYMLGQAGSALYYGISSIFQALGDAKRPLYINAFCVSMNCLLDLLFVAVFGWGVSGAAAATALTTSCSAVLAAWLMRSLPFECRIHLRDVRIHPDSLKAILKLGIPGGLESAAVSLANVLVQGSINTFGSAAMAAIGAASSIEGFAFLPMSAFSQALATFTGQNIGARQPQRTRSGTKTGLLMMSVLALAIGIVMMISARWAIGFFTSTKHVLELGIRRIRLVSLFYPVCGLTHCLSSVFRGAGKPYISMSGYIGCWGVLRVILLMLILPRWHSYDFLCLVYPVTWAVSTGLLLWFYRFYPWLQAAEIPEKNVLSAPKTMLEP